MTSGPTPKISRKKMRYLYRKLTKNYLVENLGPKPTGNPSELIFVLFGRFWGPFFKKPLNCQISKGVPYMILELCKCGKSFSQIYKAYNFHKDHVRQSIEVELRERENFSPYMYTIIKTKHLIGACNSTRVKKSYFGHTFHLTQKSFLVGG